MTTPPNLEGLVQDYRIAFLRYLPRKEETALTAGYALGRQALVGGVSLLDLVQIHHRVLAETLEPAQAEEHSDVVTAAGAFFAEVVAAYDMAGRGLLDRE
jgi:Phosphoserine phosphatase RsbU, N-terminal domain